MNGFCAAFNRLATVFFIISVLLATVAGNAHAEVFLKGNYVEVGINNAGSFGTSAPAPAGFHPTNGSLGFVADPGRDGWSVGVPPKTGDYFVPGAPEEGWMVEWTSAGMERQFHNFGLMGETDVPMTSLTDTSSGDTRSAIWQGTASSGSDRLRITQTVSFNVNDLFFTTNVVLTNIGTTTLNSLEYMRNVDPDQEQPLTTNFTTKNWVEFQPVRSGIPGRPDLPARPAGNTNKALTIAEGLTYKLTLGLGTIDSRAAVAASQGFSNRDTDLILNTPYQPSPAAPSIADSAIALAYNLGDLAPGQSTSISYAYILNKGDLDAAMGNLAAVTILQPTGTVSGTNVLFQATTDKVASTARMDFYVNGQLIGSDTTPDAGGVFEVQFDSLAFPNGTATLKAVATFTGGSSVDKTTTVAVDNSGPLVAFSAPMPGQIFFGNDIPIGITLLDLSHQPVRVSFFRETAGTGSLFLGEDTAAPFTSSFSVTGLPQGETVVIKAVAYDSLNRTTSIAVSGTIQLNMAPVADAGLDIFASCTGVTTVAMLNGLASTDPDGDALAFSWSGPFGTADGPNPSVLFGLGVHTATLTVNDGKGKTAADTVIVSVVDNTPPVVVAGPHVTLEATGPGGAAYDPSPTANDLCCDVNILVAPKPELYPLGATTVMATATDCAGNQATDSLVVSVVDTIPPVVIPPANLTVEATGQYTPVTLTKATATDAVGIAAISNNAPASFPVGTTVITWKATDAAGNAGMATQSVTVVDTRAPVIAGLADHVLEATSPDGAIGNFTATVSDLADPAPVIACTPAAGSTFPLGTSSVTCKARDASGNEAVASFAVRVQDTTPPKLFVPAAITVPLNTSPADPAIVAFLAGASATDIVDKNVAITSSAPAVYDTAGFKTVTFTATDDFGNSSTATATVHTVYNFGGFLPPVSLDKPFKLGSTVPVKFQLTDKNGNFVSSATARLSIQKFVANEPMGEPIEVFSTSGADTGNNFRFSENQYIYNLNTKSLSIGIWQLQAVLDDGSVRTAWIAFK